VPPGSSLFAEWLFSPNVAGRGPSSRSLHMSVDVSIAAFALGAIVSLATSWVLVTRLERVGERLGLSEALLGLVAAFAADAPEITASVTALVHHQRAVGAGVTIGSNVFNLAALLGVGAVVAGRIELHRKVVVLGGTVAVAISLVCLLSVGGALTAGIGLALVLVVLVPYALILSAPHAVGLRLGLPRPWVAWLTSAVVEEEGDLGEAIRPRRGRPIDVWVAIGALGAVVVASVAMEQGASSLGTRYGVAEIVIGGLVLAAVTSLPNAVAAVYLARKGRGAAALSTAFNSNAINVTAGLLIPATIVGLSEPSASGVLVAASYVGLTAVTVGLAYAYRGLPRAAGWLIIVVYAVFVVALLATT
jgi:cation:H+ antiporter